MLVYKQGEKKMLMAKSVSQVIEDSMMFDESLNEGDLDHLSVLCHDWQEHTRFAVESVGTSEFLHMAASGEFAETVLRFVDIFTLVS